MNEAQLMYEEAQQLRQSTINMKAVEEEKAEGWLDIDIADIKPEYLMHQTYSVAIPSKPEKKMMGYKGEEATCLYYNSIGTLLATGGTNGTIKIWDVT